MARRRTERASKPLAAPPPEPGSAGRRWQTVLVLVVFATAFMGLGVYSYVQTSATWDEPIHLTAGYAALTRGDHRVDPSHPPFVRMWAALPLLFIDGVSMAPGAADASPPDVWLQRAYAFSHQFLYVDNDADRLLYAARFMVLLLGVLLGVLVFFWARAWLGWWGAVAALACFALEPNLLAHATLVTTDLGVTCFMFGATYCTWRLSRNFTWWNLAGLAGCVGLAVASKFSGMLLGPTTVVLLAVSLRQGTAMTWRRAAAVLAVVAATSAAALWASYGFRYLPSASPSRAFTFHSTELAEATPQLARAAGWIDARHLLPNAFTEGVVYAGASLEGMPAFLAGTISTDGWWYYFPVAFLIKTPIALLVLIAAGVAGCLRRPDRRGTAAFIAVPAAVYLGVAMASGVNIGTRHILPIYPLLLLFAGAGATEFLRLPRRLGPVALTVVGLALVGEVARVYPNTLTFFNQFVGGPGNGHRYLLDSNLAWGQSLKGLKGWMSRAGVAHVNLAYFGQADPAYYGIDCTHLPGAPSFATDAIAPPRLPGYVALSETTIHGVYAPPEWRLFYAPFLSRTPVAIIDNAIRVYWVDEWPEALGPAAAGADADAHRALADALLFGFQWPSQAAVHYREYLHSRGADAESWVNYGMALVSADRVDEGVDAFRRAVRVDGRHGRARLTLARALVGAHDLPGAAAQAEHAVDLMPRDAEAHLLLGRIRAARGDFERAADEFRTVVDIAPQHADAREYLRRLGRTPARPSRQRRDR